MPKPLATWNSARGAWEVPQTESLLCEHLALYSATWPTSGMTRGGSAYELPTSAPHTGGSGSSSSQLLPTPTVSDTNGPGLHGDGGADLRTAVSLLPIPAVNDMGEGKTPEQWDAWTAKMKASHGNGNGHGASLAIEAQRLLPTPTAQAAKHSADDRGPGTLDDSNLWSVAARIGATTPQPSPAGSES